MNKSVEDVDDFFYNDRLDRDWLNVTDYPARIDQAAMDLLHGISVGKSSSGGRRKFVTSGDIGTFEFGRATGGFYKEGLTALSGSHSDLPTVIREYRDTDIGDLAFRFNELQYKLRKLERHSSTAQIDDMNRVLEKIIEKVLTRSIRGADEIHGQTTLQSPESVIDLMHQLFSDPSTTEYAAELINTMSSTPGGEDLLALLDSPEMVTPLWTHQREAIETWLEHGSKGYVDMATATGKTVLGLAAIATRYGALHPQDEVEIDVPSVEGVDNGRVLIVAGQDLLLEQWRSEFDEHLNIPRDRTGTGESVDHIELEWGRVEFKPAQELIAMDSVGSYDLVMVLVAARRQEFPLTVAQLADHSPIEGDAITRSYSVMVREFSLKLLPPHPRDHLPRLSSQLSLSSDLQREATKLMERADETGFHIGKRPTAVAAAVCYTVAAHNGRELTQSTVADVADVSVVTISRHHQRLSALLTEVAEES